MRNQNKDYLVTVSVTFKKKYVVNARDWEYAEDYAIEEAHGDTYNIMADEAVSVYVDDLEVV